MIYEGYPSADAGESLNARVQICCRDQENTLQALTRAWSLQARWTKPVQATRIPQMTLLASSVSPKERTSWGRVCGARWPKPLSPSHPLISNIVSAQSSRAVRGGARVHVKSHAAGLCASCIKFACVGHTCIWYVPDTCMSRATLLSLGKNLPLDPG